MIRALHPPPPPNNFGRGVDPVGAPRRTARRLNAALAAFLLLTLAAVLAPQATLAQFVPLEITSLTATPAPGQVTLKFSGSRDSRRYTWTYNYKTTQGGSYLLRERSLGNASSVTVTGLTIGTSYTFRVRVTDISGGGSNFVEKTVVATPPPPVPPVLTVKGNPDGGMEVKWTYSDYFPTGGKWQIQYFPHPQGGAPFGDFGPTSPVASTRSINISGFETGVRHAFKVRIVDANGNQVTESNWALATAGGTAAPTLVSDPSKTVRVGSEGTILVCYNLLSVIHNGITYLEKRQSKNAVATSSELKNTVHGVEITEAPAVIRSQVVGTGNVNFDPCATVGPGVHSVTWKWHGLNGMARQAGQTTTTFTVLAANRPAKPTGFTATPGNGQVLLEWNDPSDSGITRWEMQRKDGSGDYGTFGTITTGTSGGKLTHTVSGLTNGETYGFKVRAVNANGVGLPSDEQLATPANKIIALSVDSTTITEGNAGTKDVVITAILGQPAPTGGLTVSITPSATLGTASGSNKASNGCDPPLNPADTDWCYPAGSSVTIAEGATRGTVTIRILGDTRDESDETIKLTASTSTSGWTGDSITITIKDDDSATPGVTVSTKTLTVAEDGSDAYTVKLNTQSGGAVTVTPTSDNTAKATVSGALTFNTTNWSEAQTVTVTGVSDADMDDATVTISHAVTGYGSVTSAPAVRVTVTDTTVDAPVLATATSTKMPRRAFSEVPSIHWGGAFCNPDSDCLGLPAAQYFRLHRRARFGL